MVINGDFWNTKDNKNLNDFVFITTQEGQKKTYF